MAETPQFAPGDVVVHTKRPEWGQGVVDKAQLIKHEGQAAQRLVVKFTLKGRITLNTALATIAHKQSGRQSYKAQGPASRQQTMENSSENSSLDNGSDASTNSNPHSSKDAGTTMRNSSNTLDKPKSNGGGWLSNLESKSNGDGDELRKLPDALADPFLTLEQRVEATLETFRFSTEARSLIEWAIGQTGLDDPMSRYTRHELEQGFDWFCRDRDMQLKELVREAKSRGRQEMLEGVRKRSKLPTAISALDRARNSV